MNEQCPFLTCQKSKSNYQFSSAGSQENDQFENLYISSHRKTTNIQFGLPVNLIQRVPLGTPHQEVVTSLPHSHLTLTNLFISSYRGTAVIKFG